MGLNRNEHNKNIYKITTCHCLLNVEIQTNQTFLRQRISSLGIVSFKKWHKYQELPPRNIT